MSLDIVLVEPEIPPNTGNIARSCAVTGCRLHLVEPLGFSIEEKALRRAGLDYWPYVDLKVHDSLAAFMGKYEGRRKFFVSTKGKKRYTDVSFEKGDMLVFGKETAGLPPDLLEENRDMTLKIPMGKDTALRSLNLANSVNIVMFEALRQLGFPGLE